MKKLIFVALVLALGISTTAIGYHYYIGSSKHRNELRQTARKTYQSEVNACRQRYKKLLTDVKGGRADCLVTAKTLKGNARKESIQHCKTIFKKRIDRYKNYLKQCKPNARSRFKAKKKAIRQAYKTYK